MNITKFGCERLDAVLELTQRTIKGVYPNYYPSETVYFFIRHHSVEPVLADIRAGLVYVVDADGVMAGTITVDGCDIKRMFVRPSLQGRGLGTSLTAHAETLVGFEHAFAQLDASIPGYPFYFKRGYRTCECRKLDLENGGKLVYQVMRKKLW